MNGVTSVPRIERLDFFNGQRLFAEDLQTLDGFNRQMRWLHNHSLHTFGIGSGFVVRAERGDREVTVNPGYAIDNEGREIILLLPHVEPVPPVTGDGSGNPVYYDLAVHYPRAEDLEELETRGGLCGASGVVRRREEPVFCWVELNSNLDPVNTKHKAQIEAGEKIVLARISIKNCKLETLSIATRRNVRQECLPYIACGRTTEGATAWRPWQITMETTYAPVRLTIGVTAQVDTSAGRFSTVPCYSARVVGERILTFTTDLTDFTAIFEGTTSIDSGSRPNSFVLRVFLPRLQSVGSFQVNPLDFFEVGETNTIGDFLRSAGWHVEWMGIEG